MTILIVIAIGVALGLVTYVVTDRRHGLGPAMGVGFVGAFLGAFIARVTAWEFAGQWTEDALALIGAAFLLITMATVRRRA